LSALLRLAAAVVVADGAVVVVDDVVVGVVDVAEDRLSAGSDTDFGLGIVGNGVSIERSGGASSMRSGRISHVSLSASWNAMSTSNASNNADRCRG
jgi:hypothetical protein